MKNRTFVIVVCIAFLAVMVGMVYAKSNKESLVTSTDVMIDSMETTLDGYCEPMTQGFWKRICDGATGDKKLHKSTPVDFDPDLTLRDQTLCDALQFQVKNDECANAESQEAALAFNVEYGFLSESCPIFREDGSETTVSLALIEIWDMINAGECKDAQSYAEGINSMYLFDNPNPYYQANLFNVEHNHFYKDIYASVMKWLNNFLITG